jgi:MerR family transcriptional regulator, mercuric resistance operon regulatory protein
MTIGQLAQASAIQITTIRYYERVGLLPTPPRTAGGQRSYTDEHVQRLAFVRRAREVGFSIENIKLLLTLASQGPAACAQVQTLAAGRLDEIRARIRQLRQAESMLVGTLGQCAPQSENACPLLAWLERSGDDAATAMSGAEH